MNDPRGGTGRWCPDCGTPLAAGQVLCEHCGLDCASQPARDTERANAEIYRLDAQIDGLTAQRNSWVGYRKEILGIVSRVPAASHVPTDGVAVDAVVVDGVVVDAVVVDGGVVARAAQDEAATDPASAPAANSDGGPGWVAVGATEGVPAQKPSTDPSAGRFTTPFAAPTAESAWRPSASMRPARKLSAPVLLGIAGAALIILAGIVFVAVSWTTYGPGMRMAILIAFAATFAWLAIVSTKHDFASVGGALGVVSASFVGVSLYALTAGPTGPAPYTLAFASLVSGAAGLGLSKLNIKAVGGASSAAMVFAVEAGAVEAASRSVSVVMGMSLYVFIGGLGGAAVLSARSLWRSTVQRDIGTYGGVGAAFAAAAVAVLTPLVVQGPDPLPFVALFTSLMVCGGIALLRPSWAAGIVAAIVTLGAVSAASMWNLTVAQLSFVYAVAAVIVVVALGRAPFVWRQPALTGLVPGLAYVGLALLPAASASLPMALTGVTAVTGSKISLGGGLGWLGLALVLLSTLPLVTARWSPPGLVNTAWPLNVAAGAFGVATVFVAVEAAGVWAHGPVAGGLGLTVAAGAQWLAARLWGAARLASVRGVAIALATAGGVHGVIMVATGNVGHSRIVWGSVAVVLSLVALAAASVRVRLASGAWAFLAIAGASAWTWQLSSSYGNVLVVCAVTAVVIAAGATRLPIAYSAPVLYGSAPAYVVAGLAIAAAAVMAVTSSLATHPSNVLPSWALELSACVALAGPVVAALSRRVGLDAPHRVTQVVSTVGFLALALAGLSRVQEALAAADGVAPTVADAVSPALAVAVGGATYGLIAFVPWWRPARWSVGVGVVALVTLHGVVELGRLTVGILDLWWTVAAVALSAAALGVASRWVPKVALAPAVFLASLVATAGLAGHHGLQAIAAAAVAGTLVAWSARWARGQIRLSILIGGVGVFAVAAASTVYAVSVSSATLARTWTGHAASWQPWTVLVVLAVVLSLLAWPPARRIGGGVLALALIVIAGLVPAPVGWIALAAIGALATELAARWRVKLGLHPLVPLGVSFASVAWSVGSSQTVAIALCVVALASIWTAIRTDTDGHVRSFALVLAPVSGATAVFLALSSWNVDLGIAATIAAGTALTMPLVAAAAGLDRRRVVTVWILAATSVCGPSFTLDLALAGLVVVMACVAWFTLSTMGVRWARWVALGGLSAAAMLLAAAVGIATLEAYTAVPAVTMIIVGLWWMRRDEKIRTYYALAPGLGLALAPSYLALAIHPDVMERTLSLVGAALVLAVAGAALRWFAPLLATAITAVVIAASQIFVDDALFQVWVSVAIIGAVLFALALLAERIKVMR